MQDRVLKAMGLLGLVLVLLVSPPTIDASAADSATIHRGIVVVDTDSAGQILLSIDLDQPALPSDGVVDHLFVLQVKEELGEVVTLGPTMAEVLHREGFLRVDYDRDSSLILAVGAAAASTPPSRRGATVIEGYGLVHHAGDFSTLTDDPSAWGLFEHYSSLLQSAPENLCPDGGGGVYCTSGGCGASQCSLTTGSIICSVTCNSGYFACCNAGGSCKCYSDSNCSCD